MARADGDPFLTDQLLRSLRGEDRVRVADGLASLVRGAAGSVGELDLPVGFLKAVTWRLGRFSAEAKHLLEAGAVLARPFTVHEAAGLLGSSATDLAPVSEEAIAAGTLVDGPSGLTFRHDLVRSAVYSELRATARWAQHREAAVVVRAEGGGAEEVAEHLLRGGRRGAGTASEILREAVCLQAERSVEDAADLALRALDLLADSDPAVPELAAEAMRLLALAGRASEARALGERLVLAGVDPENEVVLQLALAAVLRQSGDNAAIIEYARRALVRRDLPEACRAELLGMQAYGQALCGDIAIAARSGAEAVAGGEHSGRIDAVALGATAAAIAARATGEFERSVALARRAVAAVDSGRQRPTQHHPRLVLAAALTACDQFDESDAVSAVCEREIRNHGNAASIPWWSFQYVDRCLAAGRLDEAAAAARSGLRDADETAAGSLYVSLLSALVEIDTRRDDLAAARKNLRRAGLLVGRADGSTWIGLTWRKALLQEAVGDRRQAVRTATGLDGRPDPVAILGSPLATSFLVRLALSDGSRERARRLAGAARDLATVNSTVRSLDATATHAEGLVHDDLDRLHAAVDLYSCCPRPTALAAALQDVGHAERRAGNPARADELLAEARDAWSSCGAAGDEVRVEPALRGARDDRTAGTAPPTPDLRWSNLTVSELKVARLVAEGLTNKAVASTLTLSRHTVDSHLRRSFAKMGVTSRVELTRCFLAGDQAT